MSIPVMVIHTEAVPAVVKVHVHQSELKQLLAYAK